MNAIMRLQVAQDVQLHEPPEGPPPVWMAMRPAGIRVSSPRSASTRSRLRSNARFTAPVYFSRGSRTHPRWAAMQERSVFSSRPSQQRSSKDSITSTRRIKRSPTRVALALLNFWERAEGLALDG